MSLQLYSGLLPNHKLGRQAKRKRIPLPGAKENENGAWAMDSLLQSLPSCAWKAPQKPHPSVEDADTCKTRQPLTFEREPTRDQKDSRIFLAQLSGRSYPAAVFAFYPVHIIGLFEFSTFCSILANRLRHIHILWTLQRREWMTPPFSSFQKNEDAIRLTDNPRLLNLLEWVPNIQEYPLQIIFCNDDLPLLVEDVRPRFSHAALVSSHNLSATLQLATASKVCVHLKQFAPRTLHPRFNTESAQLLPNLSDHIATAMDEAWRIIDVNRGQREVLRWIEIADKDVAHDEVDWIPHSGKCFLEYLLPLASKQIEQSAREIYRHQHERHSKRFVVRGHPSIGRVAPRCIPLPTPSGHTLEGLVVDVLEHLRQVCLDVRIEWRTTSKEWIPMMMQLESYEDGEEIRQPAQWLAPAMEYTIQSILCARENWYRERAAAAAATAAVAATAVVEPTDSSATPAEDAEPHSTDKLPAEPEVLPNTSSSEQHALGMCVPVSSHTTISPHSSTPHSMSPSQPSPAPPPPPPPPLPPPPPRAPTPTRVEKAINLDAGGVKTLQSLEMMVDDFMKGHGCQPQPRPAASVPLPVALSLPSHHEPGKLLCSRLPVLIAETFLEQHPRVISGLCSEYQVRTIDCAVRGEVDMIIDSCTAVFVLSADTIGEKMKSITNAAMKFANIWLILCRESCAVHRGDMDLFRNLARFPVLVSVRTTSLQHQAITTCLAHCIHETCVATLKQAASSPVSWDANQLRSKPFLASLQTSPLLAMRCELLQLFPTINLHVAAQLLHYWTLSDLMLQSDQTLISLLEELNPPSQMPFLAERISSFGAVLKAHCGLVAFVADQNTAG